jgi:hypothetical protein
MIVLCSACAKNQQTACGTQVCTDLFATVNMHFVDKNNNNVQVANFKVVDLRTNKVIVHIIPPNVNYVVDYQEVVDDNDIKDLSTEGDHIQVSATNPATGQIKTAIMKIAGGCRCHVTKLSGPDSITFD